MSSEDLTLIIFITAGDYTVILSAFEPRHMGPYTIRVESSHRFDFKAIPQEGAGMYTKTIRGSWYEYLHRIHYILHNRDSGVWIRRQEGLNSNDICRIPFTTFNRHRWLNLSMSDHAAVFFHHSCKDRMRLQFTDLKTCAPINITLFQSSPDPQTTGRHIITSGPYSDRIAGVDTPQVSLNPGKYMAIPSTYHPAIQADFILIVYCS